jgi:hypothetical protein
MPDQSRHTDGTAEPPRRPSPGWRRWQLAGLALAGSLVGGAAMAQAFKDYAGTWEFSISGDDQGRGTAVVDDQGHIKGLGASAKLQVPLTLSGQVGADGQARFSASSRGSTGSGATFVGQLMVGGHGAGQWQNTAFGMAGSWQAVRQSVAQEPLPTQQSFQCEIDGQTTDDPEARADLFMDTRSAKADFRIISILPEVYSMDVKARRVTGPGTAPVVNEPGWSTNLRIKRHGDRMTGNWNFKVFDVAAKRSTGSVDFSAGAHRGTCRFTVFLNVVDLSDVPLPGR